MNSLDGMYYRNRDTIKKMTQCSRYKSLLSYSTCTEDKVQKTKPVEREVEKEATAPAAAASAAAPTM